MTTPGRGRDLWPAVINVWLAGVLLLFFLIRILGSNLIKHHLRLLMGH
jgi:hypothetical protein